MAERSLPSEGLAPGDFYVVARTGGSTSPPSAVSAILDYEAAQTGFCSALRVEVKKTSGTLTSVLPVGIRVLLQNLGNTDGYLVGMRIENYSTTDMSNGLGCFIQLQNQGSAVMINGIYIGGANKPTYWLFFQTDIANGCYAKSEDVAGAKTATLAVKFGAVVRYIRLYNSPD